MGIQPSSCTKLIRVETVAKINCTLLIDDDNITNFINKRLLEKLQISNEVSVVLNGLQALEYIKEKCKNAKACPELILLDINMPVMNGFEFLKAYENLSIENKEKVRVIMLTTSTNQNDMDQLKSFTISGFLNKPLTEEKLMKVIGNAMS